LNRTCPSKKFWIIQYWKTLAKALGTMKPNCLSLDIPVINAIEENSDELIGVPPNVEWLGEVLRKFTIF